MILGVNQDVRYKGKTYHIQTEDSGPEPPVIHTHIFVGGSIVNSRRLDYSDVIDSEDMEAEVRALMRKQHKAVHDALLAGELDEVLRSNRPKLRGDIPLARSRPTRRPTARLHSEPEAGAEAGAEAGDSARAPHHTPDVPIPAVPEEIAGEALAVEISDGLAAEDTPASPAPEDIGRTIVMPALDLDAITAAPRRALHARFEEALARLLVDAPPVSPAGPARSMAQGPLPKALSQEARDHTPPEFPIPVHRALEANVLLYLAEDLEEP